MKTTSDLLWQLVRSLSSNEKLFFKRNFSGSNLPGHRIYLKLFDSIASQKKYDEEMILKKMAPALHKKNIASQKHYLYRQVCASLLQYENRDSVTHGIYNDILLIRIYRKKGLLDEAHRLWKKAVIKARQTESFAFLNLLKNEFGKMILFSGSHTRYDELLSIFKSNIISYDEYIEMITLRDIYTETLLLKRKAHFDMDESLRDKIGGLLRLVIETEMRYSGHSFWFHHYLWMNKATLLYLENDIDSSLALLKQTWKEWKKNPDYLKTNSEYYIELLYMINYAGILHGSYQYVEDIFNDSLNAMVGEAQRANFEAIKYLALNKIYNKTARYTDVEKLVGFMKAKYKQWEPVLNADLNRTLNLSLGIASFVLEKYNDAFYFTKRGLAYFRDGAREEHASVANLLLLLITYSLNNARLFDAQYRSTYFYFNKRQKKHPFETALVQCLHRTFYMKDPAGKKAYYQRTLSLLEKSKDDPVQQMMFNIFNYPGWLSSRIQRIPYREFVRKNISLTLTDQVA